MSSFKLQIKNILILFLILVIIFLLIDKSKVAMTPTEQMKHQEISFDKDINLPTKWIDIVEMMIEEGVIDIDKFGSIYNRKLDVDILKEASLVSDSDRPSLNKENASLFLNLLWAFGLSNENEILTDYEMTDEKYGGDPSMFASTGGWSLSRGDSMNHYSRHQFITLSKEEQEKVDNVSRNIYRPCCNNPAHFPDCNHGMAMLGLLELLADDGRTEEEMYEAALIANFYWFPETYQNISRFLNSEGLDLSDVSAKTILGFNYSSADGYRQVLSRIEPVKVQSGSSC